MSKPPSFMRCPDCKGVTKVRPERGSQEPAGVPQAWFSREFCPACRIRRVRFSKEWEADTAS